MEVVVTTGAIRPAKLQSNNCHQQNNNQFFYRPDALPVAQTNSATAVKGNLHVYGVLLIAQFTITINSNVCPHIRVLNTLMRESYA